MMIQEFAARTNITPSSEEYHYIEQSYYDFDGNKDEFCKQWLKDIENGKWALELRLRKAIDEQKAEYEEQLKEQEGYLVFYREQFNKYRKAQEKLDKLNKRIIAMTKIMEE